MRFPSPGRTLPNSLTITDPNAIVYDAGTLTLGNDLTTAGLFLLGFAPNDYTESGTLNARDVTIESGGEIRSEGVSSISGNVENDSTGYNNTGGLLLSGALRIGGDLTGSGTTTITGGSLLEVAGSVSQQVAVDDGGYGGAVLRLDDPADFRGTISGIAPGSFAGATNQFSPQADMIDLAGFVAASASYSGDTLTATNALGTTLTFTVTGSSPGALADSTLVAADDGHGGTDIYWQSGLTQTWESGVSGDWETAANWTTGIVPGSFDTAVIDGTAGETVTVAASEQAQANLLTMSDPNATLAIDGTLTLATNPQLSGGEIDIDGGQLALVGNTTLDNATIDMAGGEIVSSQPNDNFGGVPLFGDLALGPNLTIDQLASSTNAASVDADEALANDGTIDAELAGGTFILSASDTYNGQPVVGGISNAGQINVANGDTLDTQGFASFDNAILGTITVEANSTANLGTTGFSNEGIVSIGPNATVTVGGTTNDGAGGSLSWSNQGTITVGAGATLVAVGNYASTSVDSIENDGGTIILDGAPIDDGDYDTYVYGGSPTPPNGQSIVNNAVTAAGGTLVIDPSAGISSGDYGYSTIPPPAYELILGAQFAIDPGATLEFRGDPADGYVTEGTVTFNGAGGTLKIDALGQLPTDQNDVYTPGTAGDFSGGIEGLTFGDAIDIANADVTQLSIINDDELEILAAGGNGAIFGLDQSVWADEFSLQSDGNGGTLITFHADTTPPAVTSATATTSSGGSDIDAGTTVTITLDLREAVNVTDAPELVLSNGAKAEYAGGSGTDELTFTYTVAPGDASSPDLQIAGFNFGNGSIADLGGNALSSTYSQPLGIEVDTAAPTVSSVTTSPGDGILTIGQTATIAVGLDEPVSVALNGELPTLSLSDGGTATYDPTATAALGDPTALVFDYTVKLSDTSASALSISNDDLEGATITDAAGNQVDLSGLISAPLAIQVNTAPSSTSSGNTETYFIAGPFNGGATALWQTDGTSAGTEQIPDYSDVSGLIATGNATYFFGTQVDTGTSGLWQIDSSGTINAVNGSSGLSIPQSNYEVAIGNTLVFATTPTEPDPVSGLPSQDEQIYATDGSTVTAIQNWAIESDSAPYVPASALYTAGGEVYFLGPNDDGSDGSPSVALWETDGTAADTQQVSLTANNSSFGTEPAYPDSNPVVLGDNLYVEAQDAYGDQGVYEMSGGGDPVLTDIPSLASAVAVGNTVFYAYGDDVYATDGTATADLGPFNNAEDLTAGASQAYFVSTDANGNATIWNPKAAPTRLRCLRREPARSQIRPTSPRSAASSTSSQSIRAGSARCGNRTAHRAARSKSPRPKAASSTRKTSRRPAASFCSVPMTRLMAPSFGRPTARPAERASCPT